MDDNPDKIAIAFSTPTHVDDYTTRKIGKLQCKLSSAAETS
jgi:hypothetical protein